MLNTVTENLVMYPQPPKISLTIVHSYGGGGNVIFHFHRTENLKEAVKCCLWVRMKGNTGVLYLHWQESSDEWKHLHM